MWTEGILPVVLALYIGYGHSTYTVKGIEDMDLIISDLIQRVRNLEVAREHDKQVFIQSEELLQLQNKQLQQELKDLRSDHRKLKDRVYQLETLDKESSKEPGMGSGVKKSREAVAYQPVEGITEGQGYSSSRKVLKRKKADCHIRSASGTTVAFSANLQSGLSNPGTHRVIKFNHIITNIGDDYSQYTGAFTCEVPGLYVFFWSITSDFGDWTKTDIVKNGVAVGVTVSGDDAHDISGSNMIILSLSGGDTIWVEIDSSHDSGLNYIEPLLSSFSGFLLD